MWGTTGAGTVGSEPVLPVLGGPHPRPSCGLSRSLATQETLPVTMGTPAGPGSGGGWKSRENLENGMFWKLGLEEWVLGTTGLESTRPSLVICSWMRVGVPGCSWLSGPGWSSHWPHQEADQTGLPCAEEGGPAMPGPAPPSQVYTGGHWAAGQGHSGECSLKVKVCMWQVGRTPAPGPSPLLSLRESSRCLLCLPTQPSGPGWCPLDFSESWPVAQSSCLSSWPEFKCAHDGLAVGHHKAALQSTMGQTEPYPPGPMGAPGTLARGGTLPCCRWVRATHQQPCAELGTNTSLRSGRTCPGSLVACAEKQRLGRRAGGLPLPGEVSTRPPPLLFEDEHVCFLSEYKLDRAV